MKKSRKLLTLILSVAMVLSLAVPAMAEEKGEITILYTNDVHASFEEEITYSKVAAYKASLENVLLVDAGDHIQDTVYGTISTADTVLELMNAAGYDAATLGNHDFGNMAVLDKAQFDYVSCNVYYQDKLFQEPYKVYEVGGKKVALVGIATPETFTKSTPTNFMDEAGNIVFRFSEGEDGAVLYRTVQSAIDAAAKEADYVIALGHLGVDESSAPYSSKDVIANTTGLTAFIDGHSHSAVEMEQVADKEGRSVVLTQTGCYLAALGQMTISADGTVSTKLLSGEALAQVEPDAGVKKLEDAFAAAVETLMGEVIAATEVPLPINDEKGVRMVRKQDSAIGDLCADAFYHLFEEMDYEVDVAIMNGGGIRAPLEGEITYMDVKTVFPWGNIMCLVEISGQQLLDALEWGAQAANADGNAESGGFLSTSGLTYTINVAIPSTVQKDENGIWAGGPTGEYRVRDVKILDRETGDYQPLDLKATYKLAGINYTLRQMGDGFNMFNGEYIVDEAIVDYLALAQYLQSFPVDEKTGLPTIKAGMGYDNIAGAGRISVVNRPADLDEEAWWYNSAVQALDARLMKGTNRGFEAEANVTKATVFQTLYNLEGKPAAEEGAKTLVMPEGAWYAEAMNWAANGGLYTGAEYQQDMVIDRGEIKEILEAYCAGKGWKDLAVMKGNENGDMMLEKALTRAEFAQILVELKAGI